MSARPLVAHVTTTDMTLELLLGRQMEAMLGAGYDVVGVSAPGPFTRALAARGVRHEPLAHATRSWAPREDARALAELVSLFRRLRPSIVHTHNPKPGLYGRVAARIARVPVVVNTVHGLYAQPGDSVARRVAVYAPERVAAACSHAELVQNEEDVETLRRLGVPRRKLRLLGNGVDLTRFDPATVHDDDARRARHELGGGEPGTVVVGLVGRLVREKGFPEVFEVARLLRTRAAHVRFAVVGGCDEAPRDALTRDDVARAAADGVRFLGFRDDLHRLYRGMDVFVLASHREGFPRAAMEAAAMGVPVVATDVRGCRQVVDHGVSGLLVPPRDVPALAAAVAGLAADPACRARMGAAGRDKARREFDEQRVVQITLEVYERLLAAHAGRT